MARPRINVLALAALALSLTATGCNKSDTVLLVTVYGDVQAIEAFQFYVNVTAGLPPETHSIYVPAEKTSPITLPASFTISIDRSHTGPILITVDAKDQSGSTIATGTTMQEHPVVGGQTVIAVMLSLLPELRGSDGGAGSGGQDGAATEAGGSAAPQDAQDAQDSADGMGLDLATD